MAQWLRRASQGHQMYCYDLEATGLNSGWVELGVLGITVLSRTSTKNENCIVHDAK